MGRGRGGGILKLPKMAIIGVCILAGLYVCYWLAASIWFFITSGFQLPVCWSTGQFLSCMQTDIAVVGWWLPPVPW